MGVCSTKEAGPGKTAVAVAGILNPRERIDVTLIGCPVSLNFCLFPCLFFAPLVFLFWGGYVCGRLFCVEFLVGLVAFFYLSFSASVFVSLRSVGWT